VNRNEFKTERAFKFGYNRAHRSWKGLVYFKLHPIESTMMGAMLIETGAVTDREARELDKLAKEYDRDSWSYAFVFDRLKEERQRGITIDLAFRKFETKSKYFTIIDAPGHADLPA